jgi:hypothetical protein
MPNSVEMTCTRISALSVLYIEVVPTTSNSKKFKLFSLLYTLFQQILQVRLDQASLDLVNDISRSPLIAAGVRSIQVVLDYRPRELAADLSRFKDHRKKVLNKIYRRCEYDDESLYLGDSLDDDEKLSLGGYDDVDTLREEYRKAMGHYRSICLA